MSGGAGGGPIINIRGERVALGPLRRGLIPLYLRWTNDFTVMRTFGLPIPRTPEHETFGGGAYYERMLTSEGAVWFTIYEAATLRPIGHTDLFDIDWRNRTATFGIMIGEADCRGKGYGTETTRLMLDYAFTALSLHSVMLTVAEYNVAGRHAYERAGFREWGRRRECRMRAGRLYDLIYMECLSTDFTSPVLAAILTPESPS